MPVRTQVSKLRSDFRRSIARFDAVCPIKAATLAVSAAKSGIVVGTAFSTVQALVVRQISSFAVTTESGRR